MPTYNLIKEHTKEDRLEAVSVSPYWVVKVVRYAEPLTSSKERLARRNALHSGEVAFDDSPTQAALTRKPLIITHSCVQLSISAGKGYTQTLNAVLKPSPNINFMSALMPGDWVFAWMTHTRQDYLNLLSKIRALNPDNAPNAFDDGLKFVGRVEDIREIMAQSPNGLKTVQYNLTAVGGRELDTTIHFAAALANKDANIGTYLAHLGIAMKEIYSEAAKDAQTLGGIDINKVIPLFIDAFLGRGMSGLSIKAGGLTRAVGAGAIGGDTKTGQEPPRAYMIPEEVATTLGVKVAGRDNGVYGYSDILAVIQGIQKYSDSDEYHDPAIFYPDGTSGDLSYVLEAGEVVPSTDDVARVERIRGERAINRFKTTQPLKGTFLPTPTSFSDKPLFSLLREYLNAALNEMFMTLRVTPNGSVMPTLTIRQLPFSSPAVVQRFGDEVTGYHELPRWKVPDILIKHADVGRHNGSRLNYIHITADIPKPLVASGQIAQLVQNPPTSDLSDIHRSGLCPYMETIQTSSVSNTLAMTDWITIKSDMLLGQHLMLNGHLTTYGIRSPIAPGDNLEFNGVLYHIEEVTHSCEISANGQKSWQTQLALTHGVKANPEEVKTHGVRKEARLRDHAMRAVHNHLESQFAANAPVMGAPEQFGSTGDYWSALTEQMGGVDIQEAEGTYRNPDIYYYAQIQDDDENTKHPGLTAESKE